MGKTNEQQRQQQKRTETSPPFVVGASYMPSPVVLPVIITVCPK